MTIIHGFSQEEICFVVMEAEKTDYIGIYDSLTFRARFLTAHYDWKINKSVLNHALVCWWIQYATDYGIKY